MKTIMTLITASMLSINAIAGNPTEHTDKYCAKMKDGKKVIMHEGSALKTDVTLNNGAKVKMDGTVIKADGTTLMLKEGECIGLDGTIIEEKMNKKKMK